MNRGDRSRPRGFALVEIAIAIGIMAFALVGILSLLSVGMKTGRESTDDTVIATMATAVISQLRATNPSSATLASLATTNFYFDGNGGGWTSAAGSFGASNAASHYECRVEFTNTFTNTTASTNVRMARLTFTYPLAAPATNRQSNIVHASLAPY